MDKSKEAFLKAKEGDLMSGSLKFLKDFLSIYDVYVAACEWVEEDPKVLRAVVRDGGPTHVAIDFLYDLKGLKPDRKTKVLHTEVKQFFHKKLGEEALDGWDYSKLAVLLK